MYMKTKRHKLKNNKTKKHIYAEDSMLPYSIHKVTILSYKPLECCITLKKIFGNALGDIESPPDTELSKRNIKWMRFKHGLRAELHFVEPFNIKHTRLLRTMVEEENINNPLESQLFENHIGMYVPDLTNIIINVLSIDEKYIVTMREDGLYQLYINLPYALDYLEVDSLNIDIAKIQKMFPSFKVTSFYDNTQFVSKLEKQYSQPSKVGFYGDPNHNGLPRKVIIAENGVVFVTGRDTKKGKVWNVKGVVDDRGNATIDFSPKGGPKNLDAYITTKEVTFGDGNVWKRNTKIKSI